LFAFEGVLYKELFLNLELCSFGGDYFEHDI